jgi:thioredoxin-related protein
MLTASMICFAGYSQVDHAITFSDLSEAKHYAEEHHIPILMVFAGSDWCKPCIQFKKSILLSDSFLAYSKENLAILYLDFPLKKANKLSPDQTAKNEKLAEQYNPSGAFPEILMVDAKENILGRLTFKQQTPEEFIAMCQALTE